MNKVPDEVRAARAAALAPLFAVLEGRGVKRSWFVAQFESPRLALNTLWGYEHGHARIPPQFIERACQVLSIPASLIPIPEPRALYIQQPRSTRTHPQQPSRSASPVASSEARSKKTPAKRTAKR